MPQGKSSWTLLIQPVLYEFCTHLYTNPIIVSLCHSPSCLTNYSFMFSNGMHVVTQNVQGLRDKIQHPCFLVVLTFLLYVQHIELIMFSEYCRAYWYLESNICARVLWTFFISFSKKPIFIFTNIYIFLYILCTVKSLQWCVFFNAKTTDVS